MSQPVGASIRILHLDDNPLDARLVAMMLEIESARLPSTVHYVRTREEYLDALWRNDYDLILSDYRMTDYDGKQALGAAREICPETPFIVVTGELSEELAGELIRQGASDYVLKEHIFHLIPSIERVMVGSVKCAGAPGNARRDGSSRRRNALKRIFHLHWKWNIRVRLHHSNNRERTKSNP